MRVPLILSALLVGTLAVSVDQSDASFGLVARQNQAWGKGGRDRDWGKGGRNRDWGEGGRDRDWGKGGRDRDWGKGGKGKGGRDWEGDWNDDFDPPHRGPNHRPQRPFPHPHPRPPPRPNVCKKYYALCHRQWDRCQLDDTPPSRGPLFDFQPVTDYALSQQTCNPFACLPVLAAAPCILGAIARGDPMGLERCSNKLCDCTDCIPGLNAFSDRFHTCREERRMRCRGLLGKGKDNGKGNGKDNGKGNGKDNGKGNGKDNGKNNGKSSGTSVSDGDEIDT